MSRRCEAGGCDRPGDRPHADGGPGRWCGLHAGEEESPAEVYTWEVRRARGMSTWRLLRRERRFRRSHDLNPRALATWAAVRRVLGERGVELPDA